MEEIAQPASTAALVGVVLALVKLVEKQVSKRNGGAIDTRLSLLEGKAEDLQEDLKSLITKTSEFHKQFCEFREDVRLQWKAEETRKETIRELSDARNARTKNRLEDH